MVGDRETFASEGAREFRGARGGSLLLGPGEKKRSLRARGAREGYPRRGASPEAPLFRACGRPRSAPAAKTRINFAGPADKKGRGARLGEASEGCAGRLRSFPNPSFHQAQELHVVRLTLSHGPHRSLRDEGTASRHACDATAAVPSLRAPLLRSRRAARSNRFAEKSCRSAP